jgi:hypothetical protein
MSRALAGSRRARFATTSALAVATLVTCGACAVGGSPSAAPAAATGSGSTADLDVCALVGAEEIRAVAGTATGVPTDPKFDTIGKGCRWTGARAMVSVDVAARGSAPGDVLPDDPIVRTEPIGDGLVATGSGLVEFAADQRIVTVEVDGSGRGNRDEAADIARAVRGRLG